MRLHRSPEEAAADNDSASAAPGKRSMTESLAPVQKQGSANAPVQLMPAANQGATEDPYALHLGAPKDEPKWVTKAREYHREHPKHVEQFKAATGNACVGADGEIDPNEIARWQVAHGLKPDGICGPDTAHAASAKQQGDAPAPAPNAAPKAVEADAVPPAPAAVPAAQDPAQTLEALKGMGTSIASAASNLFDNVIDMFSGGGNANHAADNVAHDNASTKGSGGNAANTAPKPAPPAPAPSPGDVEPTPGPAPKHAPVDQGDVGDLSDATLRDIALKSSNPVVKDIAADLAGLAETSHKLRADGATIGAEEKGSARDKFVAGIATVRGKLASLGGEASFKAAAYKLIASIGTYYSQSRNIDILESPPPKDTRTCNITSLCMALEGLGTSAESYKGGHDKVQAAGKFYSHKITGDDKSKGAADATAGKGVSWGSLVGMRLPDFMELAAIARSMPDTSDDGVKAGAKAAWDSILSIYTLKELAGKFGANGSVKAFDATGTKKGKGQTRDTDMLGSFGKKHRHDVEVYINAKNSGKEKDIKAAQAGYDAAMADTSIDDQLSIETYKDYVIEHIGADLAAGGSVVIALTGHYAKLQAIVADGVIVNDPARDSRAATHLTWAEARAMGYFKHRLVLT
ncbi:MAG TPA: hypothetical protein VM261_09930 [Kofleriaceae bacterium]|nr:hypothetical protein [Kofleriaceae bacterium]